MSKINDLSKQASIPNNLEQEWSLPRKWKRSNVKWNFTNEANIANEALDHGEDDTVIEQTGFAINDLQLAIVNMLKMRATSWEQKCRYDKTVKDRVMIIKNMPYDPEAYLYVGCRYIEQGFQKRAIDIFNDGLEQVPETDAYHDSLQQRKQEAQKRLDTRFDFFAHLPYDIICRIIDNFIPQEAAVSV